MIINLLALEKCKNCEKIELLFMENNIKFNYIDGDTNSEYYNDTENLINTSVYPILILEELAGNTVEILYLAKEYADVGKRLPLGNKTTAISLYSVNEMLEYIKNMLY